MSAVGHKSNRRDAAFKAACAKLKSWRKTPSKFVQCVFNLTLPRATAQALDALPTSSLLFVDRKTFEAEWLAWNFLLTRPYAKVFAIAEAHKRLLVTMRMWQSLSQLLSGQFRLNGEAFRAVESPDMWFMMGLRSGDDMSGIVGDHLMVIFDERDAIPDATMSQVLAAIHASEEGRILILGERP